MFEVPHYHYQIKEWTNLKRKVMSSLKVREPEKVPNTIDCSITTSYWDTFDFTEYGDFLTMVQPYVANVPNVSQVTRVWFQTSSQNDFHSAHNHGSIGWSAVFYADFNPDVHVPTKFYCPFSNVTGNIDVFCPNVEEGDLIIFPASVLHEAPINTSNTPRTIISFNLF